MENTKDKKKTTTKNGFVLLMSNTQKNFYPHWIKRDSAEFVNSLLTGLNADKTKEYSKSDVWRMQFDLMRYAIQQLKSQDIGVFESFNFQCARPSDHSETISQSITEQPIREVTAQADTSQAVDSLQVWINDSLKVGYTPDQLIQSLKTNGYQKEVIAKYFDLNKFCF